ncbi:MAG: glycosyltransferase [Clostridia bacterium]|nr:glycosyltransferase [Clostridia bacterium]
MYNADPHISKQRPKCSVVIPAYNAAAFLPCALDSLLAQTHSDFECIVVDDCSSDATFSIAQEYAQRDARFSAVRSSSRGNAAGARNRGVALARGEYVAFLDSDDAFLPQKLEIQLAAMQRAGAEFSCTAYELVDERFEPLEAISHVAQTILPAELIVENTVGCSTVMARRELLLRHPFDSSFFHEDYVCWLACIEDCGSILGIDEPLTKYRFMRGSKSGNKLRSCRATYDVYRRYLGFPIGKTLRFMYNYVLRKARKYRSLT